MSHKMLTLKKLYDQAIKDEPGIVPTRKLATVLIILSSILLYLDKIFSFIGYFPPMPHKYIEAEIGPETFIWLVMQGFFSPLVLIIGFVWPEPKSSAAGSRMLQLIQIFLNQKIDR